MHYTCVGMTATETQTRAQKGNLQNSMKSEQEFKSHCKQMLRDMRSGCAHLKETS